MAQDICVLTVLPKKARQGLPRRIAAPWSSAVLLAAAAYVLLTQSRAFVCPSSVQSSARVVSRDAGSENIGSQLAAMASAKSKASEDSEESLYEPNQVLSGSVKTVKDTGLVIKVDGSPLSGFVHVSQLKEGYVRHPIDIADVGDKVKVSVLKHEPGFLSLTMKKARSKDLKDFLTGQKVEGVVNGVTALGAYINIGTAKDAFLFRGNIPSETMIRDAREYVQIGDKLTAWVKSKNEQKGIIEVTMKEEVSMQSGLKVLDFKEGQEMGGVITAVKAFGVFVKVGAEAEGLLHARNINDGIVDRNKLGDLLQVGDTVVVKALKVRKGKLELELVEPLERLPPVDGLLGVAEDEELLVNVTGTLPFGLLVDVQVPSGGLVTGLLGWREFKSRSIPKEVEEMFGKWKEAKRKEDYVTADSLCSIMRAKGFNPTETKPVRIGETLKARILKVDVKKKQVFFTQQTGE
eukprot:TRINITY_DN68231_c0_g1_i1.p1 TRINITY_DN68231_c0_g1~~TRINITY_DN68231_c0_g1_i1.p1  ORF type:complete len:477 (-),score=116.82 TRINITY_DN68231_c0_g1_i1:11-1399(-)